MTRYSSDYFSILIPVEPEVFTDRRGKAKSQEPSIEELYQNIGRLQVELEWLKKKSGLTP
jgi:hypothetical protein